MKLSLPLVVTAVLAFAGSCNTLQFRNCSNGVPLEKLPSTVSNTTEILANLRKQMKQYGLAAYIVPTANQHQSEYLSPASKRLDFITGFHGSAGTAVVTLTKAALWTDGRYFDQAESELDCNWILQRQGMRNVPSIDGWLKTSLQPGDKTGIDPMLINYGAWEARKKALNDSGVDLLAVSKNLVDLIWTSRPTPAQSKVEILGIEYTGMSWQKKVANLRTSLQDNSLSGVVLSNLLDVAWLLNLRGSDIPYNPLFLGYVFVTLDEICLFVDQKKIDDAVKNHLCPDSTVSKDCIKLKDYGNVKLYVSNYLKTKSSAKVSFSEKEGYFLSEDVAVAQRYFQDSPVELPKAIKNPVEQMGMKKANLKDSVAIIQFFSWLERELQKETKGLTELSTSAKLTEFKSQQSNFKGLSFNTIAGFGPNGATIHYRANNLTNRAIDTSAPYLVDSGCQFPEGTTDITRTFHFGKPTDMEKRAFTHVLQGTIELITAVFPEGTYGYHLDVLARSSLWRDGMNYNHGTGHGIGHYLSVHEGPQSISSWCSIGKSKQLKPGMVLSDEPGYYETGKFGIRLETDMIVVKANTMYHFDDVDYFTFEPITFVPFCTRLTDVEMLTMKQKTWLNSYNKMVRQSVGPELKKIGDSEALDWMMRETEAVPVNYKASSSSCTLQVMPSCVLAVLFLFTVFWGFM